jgi:hypothetical protein
MAAIEQTDDDVRNIFPPPNRTPMDAVASAKRVPIGKCLLESVYWKVCIGKCVLESLPSGSYYHEIGGLLESIARTCRKLLGPAGTLRTPSDKLRRARANRLYESSEPIGNGVAASTIKKASRRVFLGSNDAPHPNQSRT